MMITTTQRQIERAAEKDLDAAEAAMDSAEDELGIARLEGLFSWRYCVALRTFDRSRSTYAFALVNLEKTRFEEEN